MVALDNRLVQLHSNKSWVICDLITIPKQHSPGINQELFGFWCRCVSSLVNVRQFQLFTFLYCCTLCSSRILKQGLTQEYSIVFRLTLLPEGSAVPRAPGSVVLVLRHPRRDSSSKDLRFTYTLKNKKAKRPEARYSNFPAVFKHGSKSLY